MGQDNTNQKTGIFIAFAAYTIWGGLPLFWKLAGEISDLEILAYRIIWSFVLMVLLIVSLGKHKVIYKEIRDILHKPKTALVISMATILITTNWFIFIFAVNSNHVLEASLGYYINPIINVILGMLLLKERLNVGEIIAVITVTAGVVMLTWSHGELPWAALSMALTFSLYGFIKKTVPVTTWTGLTLETMLITPFALIYLFFFTTQGFMSYSLNLNLVLVGTGVATATPLLLFTAAAKRISYTMIGFIQYLAPTMMLLIAIFLFDETFSQAQFIAFILIWIALIIYTLSNIFLKPKHLDPKA